MYWLTLILGVLGGVTLGARGLVRKSRRSFIAGALLAAATLAFFGGMSFWGEALWFEEIGYGERFWKEVVTIAALGAGGALAGGALVYSLSRDGWLALLGTALGLAWWASAWEMVLLFVHGGPTGERDPIFGLDIAFHLFQLPFYSSLLWFSLTAAVLVAVATAVRALTALGDDAMCARTSRRLPRVTSVVALLLAGYFAIAPFHLLTSRLGIVHGAGWTDVWVRRPGYYLTALVALLVAGALLTPALRRKLERGVEQWLTPPPVNLLHGSLGQRGSEVLATPAGAAVLAASGALGVIASVWVLAVWFVPALFQWLRVGPQELTVERPYIEHNIAYTRAAFGLDEVEDREFPVADELSEETLRQNQHILSEIRLWDPRALAAVYQQFQEIRLYYEMDGVDIDRYTLGGRYRQVMVAAREMDTSSLPADGQTFVNRRFKYTHGFGMAMSPVSEFRGGGLPEMFIKDLPPQSSFESVEIDRPEIYYGERTHEHVIANSSEPEFNYPQGKHNSYAHYEGEGGVPISSFFRRLLFGWKFDGTQLLVSSYVRPQSRILFHRQIRERVQRLAPFLAFDEDPYLVTQGGRLYWLLDGYTTSRNYPYSEPFSTLERIELPEGQFASGGSSTRLPNALHGANYVRNAVKATVDAYDGSVKLYLFEPDDPIATAWGRALPGLLEPRSSMPPELEQHVRYPEGLLLAQARVYSKYHMTDPGVFYNQEDLWVRATEKYYEQVQPVDPYYVIWEPSGSKRPEFILMQPFSPKNRQVLIGWIAGMCDPPNYGRLLAYHFPKDERVLGTQQVDTKIDQDPNLSAQLTLWNQQGKRVIRGNVLAIPLSDTLLYVEPIYIQADVAAYPELRLVVVMHDDRMSYAPSFDKALAGLVGPAEPSERQQVAGRVEEELAPSQLEPRSAARAALNGYLRATGEGRFEDAGRHLQELQQLIEGRAAGEVNEGVAQ